MFTDSELCFYSSDNEKDLKKQLLSFIAGKDLICRFGRNGKTLGIHNFDARKHAKILRSWLKSLP